MTTMKALTPHQFDVLRSAARFLNRETPITAGPRAGGVVRNAVIGCRYAQAPTTFTFAEDMTAVVTYGAYVGSPGALEHLADKGYLSRIRMSTGRVNRRAVLTGYVWTDEGKAWWDRTNDPATAAKVLASLERDLNN